MNDMLLRVEKLERSNRRMRVGFLSLLAATGCALLIGADKKGPEGKNDMVKFESVMCDRLFVKSALAVGGFEDKAIVRISTGTSEAGIELLTAKEQKRASMYFVDGKGATIALDGDSRSQVTLQAYDRQKDDVASGNAILVVQASGEDPKYIRGK
jgi:hypothetical protein